jgi:prevent-host-death family protein
MKTATAHDFQRQAAACMDAAQHEPVVITRYGRPVAILTGVAGYDWEDIYYMTNKAFRQEIGSGGSSPPFLSRSCGESCWETTRMRH